MEEPKRDYNLDELGDQLDAPAEAISLDSGDQGLLFGSQLIVASGLLRSFF